MGDQTHNLSPKYLSPVGSDLSAATNNTFSSIKSMENKKWDENKMKAMNLEPKRSESETNFIKSPDTWNSFDKENGIYGDEFVMGQMMGQLEEGAICCSYD